MSLLIFLLLLSVPLLLFRPSFQKENFFSKHRSLILLTLFCFISQVLFSVCVCTCPKLYSSYYLVKIYRMPALLFWPNKKNLPVFFFLLIFFGRSCVSEFTNELSCSLLIYSISLFCREVDRT